MKCCNSTIDRRTTEDAIILNKKNAYATDPALVFQILHDSAIHAVPKITELVQEQMQPMRLKWLWGNMLMLVALCLFLDKEATAELC
nr:hypothetical protein [Tanacetum cinerariifolium]